MRQIEEARARLSAFLAGAYPGPPIDYVMAIAAVGVLMAVMIVTGAR